MDDDPRQWIAAVCWLAREERGVGCVWIATAVGRESDAIRNFETLRGQWSPITGEIVNTYIMGALLGAAGAVSSSR